MSTTNATTTPNETTIADFERLDEILDKAFCEIYDLAVYARTSELRPHHDTCDLETCAYDHKVYADKSLALAHISQIEQAIIAIRDNAEMARMALSKLSVNAGVEFDNYPDDTLRIY